MHPFMEDAALGGQPVFHPLLFNVDQGALTRTEQVVLQGGDHDQVVLGEQTLAD
jgi:hypothetical protein